MSEKYTELIREYSEKLTEQKKRDRYVSFARFTLLAIAIYLFYRAIKLESWPDMFWGFLPLGGFLALLFLHKNIRNRAKRFKELVKINEEERAFLQGDLDPFDNGEEFIDREHPYSFDLDIFGSFSLFHHLNRCATIDGKNTLAASLSTNSRSENIETKQQLVAELTDSLNFRQQFMLEGRLLEEDPALRRKLRRWRQDETSQNLLQNPWLLYFFSAIAIGTLLNWIIQPGVANFYILIGAAALNISLVLSQMKHIRKEQKHLNGLGESLLIYSRLFKLIESRNVKESSEKASEHLHSLSRICDEFDQLNNPMGSMIMNGLFLFHLHSLKKLVRWKNNHSEKITNWLDEVARWDELQSLANWSYNNPQFNFPTITQNPHYHATNLGHPLIQSSKRVANSISFDAQNFVILTGSNMSGKSTFLKTLGMNLVLAKAGAAVCASDLTVYPFPILSSMKMVDSIEKEQSYFQAEVLRLKKLMHFLNEGSTAFVLLDEILRGTNSDDKRKGTRLFLEKIAQTKALGVIATHDIDIADMADLEPETFRDLYFESKFEKGELHFDYKLRAGVCTTPNATELMKAHGII